MNVPNIAESARNSQLAEENNFLRGQNQALAAIINYMAMTLSEGNCFIPADFNNAIKDTKFDLVPGQDGYQITSTPMEVNNDEQHS